MNGLDTSKSSSSKSLVSVGSKRKHDNSSDVSFEFQQEVNTSTTSSSAKLEYGGVQNSSKFAGKSLNKIFALEICAGSARLSKAAVEQGFASIAIDHKSDRSCGIAIQHYDLADPSHLESLICFIKENKDDIAMVWMAQPCGTASRARERPLKHLERQGLSVPKPRSKDQPDQLDGLGGLDKIKTETANILYDSTMHS